VGAVLGCGVAGVGVTTTMIGLIDAAGEGVAGDGVALGSGDVLAAADADGAAVGLGDGVGVGVALGVGEGAGVGVGVGLGASVTTGLGPLSWGTGVTTGTDVAPSSGAPARF
jgi:hypothetical protein